jgi:hypothetical protein
MDNVPATGKMNNVNLLAYKKQAFEGLLPFIRTNVDKLEGTEFVNFWIRILETVTSDRM